MAFFDKFRKPTIQDANIALASVFSTLLIGRAFDGTLSEFSIISLAIILWCLYDAFVIKG